MAISRSVSRDWPAGAPLTDGEEDQSTQQSPQYCLQPLKEHIGYLIKNWGEKMEETLKNAYNSCRTRERKVTFSYLSLDWHRQLWVLHRTASPLLHVPKSNCFPLTLFNKVSRRVTWPNRPAFTPRLLQVGVPASVTPCFIHTHDAKTRFINQKRVRIRIKD